MALTLTEGVSNNHDKFFVTNSNKDIADFLILINNPKLTFWPKGKHFGDLNKGKLFFDIENIKMAISSFQGHAALAQLAYPSKINDLDFISKVIICPLKKHIDLISGLIRSFRSKVLPRQLKEDIRDSIVKASTRDIWVLSDEQTTAINSCFRGAPFLRGGDTRFRGRRSGFGYRTSNSYYRGKPFFLRGSRYNFGARGFSFPYRRSGRQGGRRGIRGQGSQSAENSEFKTKK